MNTRTRPIAHWLSRYVGGLLIAVAIVALYVFVLSRGQLL